MLRKFKLMKIKLINLLILLYAFTVQGQQENLGIIVEYTAPIDLTFQTYEPPLKIIKASQKESIDYKEIEGLLQSFFSASDMEWVLSDYLAENATTPRDETHFEAIKKIDADKNYIQLEMVYGFNYQDRQMAYVRYSFIMNQMPFPIIGILSAEFSEGRWFINTLLNQSDVFTVLSNLEPAVLKQLFSGKSTNADINKIIAKTKRNGQFDMFLMGQLYSEFNKDESIRSQMKDKRLIIEDYEFKNASLAVKPVSTKYTILNPFVLDQAKFSKYTKKDKGVLYDEKGQKAYESKPEAIVLKTTPIDFMVKLEFTTQRKTFHLIKYFDSEAQVVLIANNEGNFSISQSKQFDSWKMFFTEIKSEVLNSIFNKDNGGSKLQKIIKDASRPDGGINIDALIAYFEDNRSELDEYYDN